MVVTRFLVLVVSALSLAAGASGAGQKGSSQLYGLLERAGHDDLVRVDPGDLRPVGERLDVGEFGHGWAFSPDRSRLALGSSHREALRRTASIGIVDLRRWRSERLIALGGERGLIQAISWVGNRLLALASYPQRWDVIAVDPDAGRVIGRTTLDGLVLHAVPTVRGLTLLTGPRTGLGPAAVVRVEPTLRLRSVTLDRVTAGSGVTEDENGNPVAGPRRSPGFALRPGALRAVAYVLGAGAPPAAVDLGALTVRYSATRTLAVASKSREASLRFAQWAGGHAVVFGGVENTADAKATRVGVSLLDTSTWNARVLDPNASTAVAGGGLVVTWDSWPAVDRTLGVRVFGADGAQRFTALPRAAVGAVQIAGDRALVRLSGSRVVGKVLNLRTGAVVTTIRGNVPTLLVGRASGW